MTDTAVLVVDMMNTISIPTLAAALKMMQQNMSAELTTAADCLG
jgi:hypothetical protein